MADSLGLWGGSDNGGYVTWAAGLDQDERRAGLGTASPGELPRCRPDQDERHEAKAHRLHTP